MPVIDAATAQEIRQGATPFSGWAINLRCLDGFDPDSVADHKINGHALPLT